jgi:hypothetical protein
MIMNEKEIEKWIELNMSVVSLTKGDVKETVAKLMKKAFLKGQMVSNMRGRKASAQPFRQKLKR